jgi:hypothetical protein
VLVLFWTAARLEGKPCPRIHQFTSNRALPPNHEFPVFVDGVPAGATAKSNAAGVATVQVDLKARHTIQLGGNKSVVTILPPLQVP